MLGNLESYLIGLRELFDRGEFLSAKTIGHDALGEISRFQSTFTDDDSALLKRLTAELADVARGDRAETAARLLAAPAWTSFETRLTKGPAEYGALVHGMIAFGESATA